MSPEIAKSSAAKTVAEFSIPYVQYLDSGGQALGALPSCADNHAELVKMYRTMVLARTFDAKAVNLQRIGKLGTYPPAVGHEAVQVACGAALKPEDCIAPVYREIGTQLWRGVRMTDEDSRHGRRRGEAVMVVGWHRCIPQ